MISYDTTRIRGELYYHNLSYYTQASNLEQQDYAD